jgi:hypothetical protein
MPSFCYQLPMSFPVGTTARLVAHADLNGDGKEDLIFAGQSAHERQRGVEILEGNGDGTFGTSYSRHKWGWQAGLGRQRILRLKRDAESHA